MCIAHLTRHLNKSKFAFFSFFYILQCRKLNYTSGGSSPKQTKDQFLNKLLRRRKKFNIPFNIHGAIF